ncbi:DUF3883 domain-containing protein [Peribacillus frigoritolerans]|uniref:DUF3883 domain-containing protein n=1 Tax=Peribacillus frigoritolerans TaxID=450367 RepID=UPI001070D489|nr:DUF3883 domain-containing protein [Peribacillus frigoritolerans]TFH59637.1 DUF3883 domain-containing protein [Peribacillus frigoritolerans]
MNDSWFKISVIDGAINICLFLEMYPECSINDAIERLRTGPVSLACYDYQKAQALGELVGWETFSVEGSRCEKLRGILKSMLIYFQPFWARHSYLGRDKVIVFLNDNALQCLKIAGLLESPLSDAVMTWWEGIGRFFRSIEESRKLQIGREGERKSFNYEKIRLRNELITREPEWIALVDNTANFDILSYKRFPGDLTSESELMIEVKACTYEPKSFILTRNEWLKAIESPNSYMFHIWNLVKNELTVLTVEQMLVHIPSNHGNGKWETVKVVLDY